MIDQCIVRCASLRVESPGREESPIRIGAHVSVAKGYEAAAQYAASVGCECLQIFAKSPRQWVGPPIDLASAARFTAARAELGLWPLCTHTAYLINLATADDVLWTKSVEALSDELLRGSAVAADYVVTHLGADSEGNVPRAAARIAEGIDRAFALACFEVEPPVLVLENTAGAGRQFGGSFEEIGDVIGRIRSPDARVGVCVDTCHAHAFGHDLVTFGAWRDLVSAIESSCGVGAVKVIHANDCTFPAGSKRDRHAWIGDGTIGSAGFAEMLAEPALSSACAITEMPGEVPLKDATNIARLRGLREA